MSKRKLLLADDSVTIQKVVNLTFADEGIEVISVGDGDSAMEKVAEVSPDLIMADVNMPGLTGYEICERIRHDEKLSRTPVILLVGSFEPFDEDEARRVGADDYLTKPFQSIRQLVNKVTVLLDSQNNLQDQVVNVSSLEDTLEMDADDLKSTAESSGFEDKGFDDEMIQTNNSSNFAFDETQKFEYREPEQLSQPTQFEEYNDFEETKVSEYLAENKESETAFENTDTKFEEADADQESNVETVEYKALEFNSEVSDFDVEASKRESFADETIEEESALISEETNESDEEVTYENKSEEVENFEVEAPETVESSSDAVAETTFGEVQTSIKNTEEDIPLPEFASVLEFDDDDILQLPPLELEFEEEEDVELPKNSNGEISAQTVAFVSNTENNTVTDSSSVSSELIDEIVKRVLERLSDKAIKEVAWEVVPPMTELIVKKMAEDKLRD